MPTPLPAEIQALLAHGDKLEAIKRLRSLSGLSLSAAKAAVDTGWGPDWPPPASEEASPVPGNLPGLPVAARTALQDGRVIEAVKITRSQTGLGLRDSKAVVDAALAAEPMLQQRASMAADLSARQWRLRGLGVLAALALLVIAAKLEGWW